MQIESGIAETIGYGRSTERYTHIETEFVDETRWGSVWRTVYLDSEDDRYYAFEWERGATEMQDYDDFDDVSHIEVEEVKPFRVTVTEFHKV